MPFLRPTERQRIRREVVVCAAVGGGGSYNTASQPAASSHSFALSSVICDTGSMGSARARHGFSTTRCGFDASVLCCGVVFVSTIAALRAIFAELSMLRVLHCTALREPRFSGKNLFDP